MWHGLNITWNLGFKRIILEVDSLAIISLVTNKILEVHPCWSLASKVKSMMDKDWDVHIKHTWQEGNRVADICANLGHFCQEGLVVLEDIP